MSIDVSTSWSELIESPVLATLLALLPGLLAAAVVDALTVKRDLKVLERVVQALLLTFLSYVLWAAILLTTNVYRQMLGLGEWTPTPTRDLLGLAASALLVGLLITYLVNGGRLHAILSHRCIRLTKRSSHPNEWYEAFFRQEMYVVAHLNDGRRLYGYPQLYPEQPDRGHILLVDAAWLDDSSESQVRTQFLLRAEHIEFIEFVPYPEEVDHAPRRKFPFAWKGRGGRQGRSSVEQVARMEQGRTESTTETSHASGSASSSTSTAQAADAKKSIATTGGEPTQ